MLIRALVLLALRNVLRHLRHSVFSLAAIAAGVAALALADGFVQDVYHQLQESTVRGQLGHLQVSMPGFREAGSGNPEAYVLPRPAALSKAIGADDRVASVMSRLSFSAPPRSMPASATCRSKWKRSNRCPRRQWPHRSG